MAGTHIFGGNGSGKTTGSGQTIAKAFLRAGFGGLVLCAKPDERVTWQRYAQECGRSKHLIIVSPDAPWRFNFIEYELRRPGDTSGRVENLLSTLMNILEQTGRERAGGEDSFWQQAAELLLRNALMVLTAATPQFTLFDLQRLIDTAPVSPAEAASSVWQQTECARYLSVARASFEAAQRQADFQVLHNYWTVQFPALADRTRSSITFTLSTILQDLQIGTIRELFATGTNFFPEDTHEGAIIILDLPAVLNRTHAVAQTLFKVVWQQAALRRMGEVGKHTRPIFLWADEAHFFVSPYDTSFQSLARATRAATVYMTQNLSAYHHRLPARNAEAIAHALLGYFQTQVFHAQADPKTIQHAQSLFGRRAVTRTNESASWTKGRNQSYSQGGNSSYSHTTGQHSANSSSSFGGGRSWSDSWGHSEGETRGYTTSTTIEDVLQAHHFTALKSGTDQENGISEAIIFRTGRAWSDGHTYLFTQFNRHLR
ncbi:MAG: type IV secretion system DNA-binding domain-containing protein [Hyphomicrobiales bacterium]|nr:type IV secretion system DNA-binding domain-containing protein [Hyphomicrobiales bacterium]